MNEGCRGKSCERPIGHRPPHARSRRSAALGPRPAFSVAELLAQMPFIRAIRGRMGDTVFKTYGRKIIVTRVPRFAGYVPSPAQRARRARMSEATAYAKFIYAHPAAKAIYVTAAKKLHRQPFRLAVSDYLTDHPRVTQVASLCTQPTVSVPPLVSSPPPSSSATGSGHPLFVCAKSSVRTGNANRTANAVKNQPTADRAWAVASLLQFGSAHRGLKRPRVALRLTEVTKDKHHVAGKALGCSV